MARPPDPLHAWGLATGSAAPAPRGSGAQPCRNVLHGAKTQARPYGVRSAMPGFIGKALCPGLVFVAPRFDKYVAASEETRAVFLRYDPHFRAGSLDEVRRAPAAAGACRTGGVCARVTALLCMPLCSGDGLVWTECHLAEAPAREPLPGKPTELTSPYMFLMTKHPTTPTCLTNCGAGLPGRHRFLRGPRRHQRAGEGGGYVANCPR